MNPIPEPLIERRAGVIFDVLVTNQISGGQGLTHRQLRRHLEAQGLLQTTDHSQLVTDAIARLRKMFSAEGDGNGSEVVTCARSGANSIYQLAIAPEHARQYRRERARHIASEIQTLVRQVRTEKERFGGSEIFTDAALRYFENGLAELDRASEIDLMTTP